MYSKITKVFILLIFVKQVFGTDFCDQKEFKRIHTKEIYTKNNNTYSLIEIIVDDKGYYWDLESNKVFDLYTKPDSSNKEKILLTRIYIPTLKQCKKSVTNGDCEQLWKLSDIAIEFYVTLHEPKNYSYKITKYTYQHGSHVPKDEELPWNMSATGQVFIKSEKKRNLWPDEWINQFYPLAAYDPIGVQLIYVIIGNPQGGITTIFSKSLRLDNWAQKWKEIPLKKLYSFIGIATVMAINDQTKHTIWDRMDRVFLFEDRMDEVHAVYEYDGVESVIKSDFSYYELFGCSEKWSEMLIFYVIIAVLVVVIVILIIAGIVGICFYVEKRRRGQTSKTTENSKFASASASASSKSSGSISKSGESKSQSEDNSRTSRNSSQFSS